MGSVTKDDEILCRRVGSSRCPSRNSVSTPYNRIQKAETKSPAGRASPAASFWVNRAEDAHPLRFEQGVAFRLRLSSVDLSSRSTSVALPWH